MKCSEGRVCQKEAQYEISTEPGEMVPPIPACRSHVGEFAANLAEKNWIVTIKRTVI